MSASLWKVLAVLAVLLMPFGMAAAPAAAHAMPTAKTADHCGENQPQPAQQGKAQADCSIACAATLPVHPHASIPLPQVGSTASSAPMPPLAGLVMELATPPPRRS